MSSMQKEVSVKSSSNDNERGLQLEDSKLLDFSFNTLTHLVTLGTVIVLHYNTLE